MFIFEVINLWFYMVFTSPFSNFEVLWILVPVYLSWFLSEFFQEKQGTSIGNAITNGVVATWAGIDWLRTTMHLADSDGTALTLLKVIFCLIVTGYGIIIIIEGIKTREIVKYMGRVREVTYAVAVGTPVIYNVVSFDLKFVVASVVFAPVFYFVVELFDRYLPTPKAMLKDLQEAR